MSRPWYLTVLLILFLLGAVFTAIGYTLGSTVILQAMPDLPSWYLTVGLALAVVEFVAVVLLWQWKMVGFYLLAGMTAIAAVLNLMYMGTNGLSAVVFGVIGLGLLYLAMKPVWANFK